jgi:hypothetical protein
MPTRLSYSTREYIYVQFNKQYKYNKEIYVTPQNLETLNKEYSKSCKLLIKKY